MTDARDEPVIVAVPLLDAVLEAPPSARVRALKRHLVQAMRDLRVAKRPDRLIQKRTPAPEGYTAQVLAAGCATCQGHCCKGGGEHAYLDERTIARARHENPGLGARAIMGLYLARLAPVSYRASCLFHGPEGCTLGRALRAELCNLYHCNGLLDFLKRDPKPEQVRVVATRGDRKRESGVLTRSEDGGESRVC